MHGVGDERKTSSLVYLYICVYIHANKCCAVCAIDAGKQLVTHWCVRPTSVYMRVTPALSAFALLGKWGLCFSCHESAASVRVVQIDTVCGGAAELNRRLKTDSEFVASN